MDSGSLSPWVTELSDRSRQEGVSHPCLDRWQVSGWVTPGQGCGHLRMEQVDVVSENLVKLSITGPFFICSKWWPLCSSSTTLHCTGESCPQPLKHSIASRTRSCWASSATPSPFGCPSARKACHLSWSRDFSSDVTHGLELRNCFTTFISRMASMQNFCVYFFKLHFKTVLQVICKQPHKHCSYRSSTELHNYIYIYMCLCNSLSYIQTSTCLHTHVCMWAALWVPSTYTLLSPISKKYGAHSEKYISLPLMSRCLSL